MHPNDALHRLETTLHLAAERFGSGLMEVEDTTSPEADLRSLLARWNLPCQFFPSTECEKPVFSASDLEAALPRLRSEGRRLSRLARVRHPAYDLNRHIAVRRLLSFIDPARSPSPARPTGHADRSTSHRLRKTGHATSRISPTR